MLVAYIMNSSGVTKRIFQFALACVGHVRGSLGHVNILGSLIFAGMSGSAVADAAGLGAIEIKAMTEEGFDVDFSAGVTAASACIGPVFPPSVIFLIFGAMAEVPVGRLFIGGMVPGVLMAPGPDGLGVHRLPQEELPDPPPPAADGVLDGLPQGVSLPCSRP